MVTSGDRYLYFHVPKTAGKSVRLALAQVFGEDQVSPTIGVEEWAQLRDDLPRYRVVAGHFTYDQLAAFPGYRRFTLLRDPVDVIVSKYYYYRGTPELPPLPQVNLCRGLSLREIADRGGELTTFFNDAVCRFSGLGFETFARPADEVLAIAKANLASFDVVGIYEEMDAWLDLMCRTFGWPPIETLPRINTSAGRPAVTELEPGTAERILEANALDAALYRFARELFEERRAADGAKQISRPAPLTVEVPAVSDVRILRTTAGALESGSAMLRSGERCMVRIVLLANVATPDVSITLRVVNLIDILVYSTVSSKDGEYLDLAAGAVREVVFVMPFAVAPGLYRFFVDVQAGREGVRRLLDTNSEAVFVEVTGFAGQPFGGLADLPTDVSTSSADVPGHWYGVGRDIDFTAAGDSQLFTLAGWSTPETGGRWTDGPEAELLLRLRDAPPDNLHMIADVLPFCHDAGLTVDAIVNGSLLATWEFSPPGAPTRCEVAIPASLATRDHLHVLFRVKEPKVPSALGLSEDSRALGLAFQRLSVSRLNQQRMS